MRNILSVIASFLLLFTVFSVESVNAQENDSKKLTFNLKFNLEESIEDNKLQINDDVLNQFNANFNKNDVVNEFKQNNKNKINLKLDIDKFLVESEDDFMSKGEGFIKFNQKKYNLQNVNGSLEETIINDDEVYSGTLLFTAIDKDKKKVNGSMKLIFKDKSTAVANVTLGTLDDEENSKGMGLLSFGEPFPELKELVNDRLKKINKQNTSKTPNVNTYVRKPVLSTFGTNAVASSIDSNDWKYEVRNKNDWYESIVLGNGSVNDGESAVYLMAYSRGVDDIGGSIGQEHLRAFTNSDAVQDAISPDYFYAAAVKEIQFEFSWDDQHAGVINKESYPLQSQEGNTIDTLLNITKDLSSSTLYNVAITLTLANIQDGPVEDTNGDGKRNYYKKIIGTEWDDGTDIPSAYASSSEWYKQDGGAYAEFHYSVGTNSDWLADVEATAVYDLIDTTNRMNIYSATSHTSSTHFLDGTN